MARKPLPSVGTTEPIAGDGGRRPRRLLLGAFAAALALAMSGCVIFKSTSSTQLNVVGKVQITTTICASDTSDPPNQTGYNPQDPACQKNVSGGNPNAGGNSNADALQWNVQVKLAYRVPTTVTAPASFTSTDTSNPPTTPCGGGITFNQSASYSSALTSASPPGAGKQWVGYLSTVQNFTNAGCQYITASPEFTLNQGAGGSPFQGPFNYRVVTGFRRVDEGTPGNTSSRTVTCGADAFALYNDGVDGPDGNTDPDMTGICIDNPNSSTVATDLSQATRDLGVVAGSPQSVQAGQQATVPFTLKYRGTSSPTFNLSASSNLPGSPTVTPSQSSITPATDSDSPVTASVTVPPNTPPGTYDVTFTATGTGGASGQARQSTNTVTVGEAFGFSPAPALPSLGSITLNGQAQTKTATMTNFGVIDSPGSSDQGWNVTVVGNNGVGKSNVFKQYCPNAGGCGPDPQGYVSGGFTLPANSLALNTSGASWTGGTGSAPSFQCNGGCAVDRSTAIKIASAPNGGGTALWTTSGFSSSSLSLATASTLRALPASEQYRVDLVWTLGSGP